MLRIELNQVYMNSPTKDFHKGKLLKFATSHIRGLEFFLQKFYKTVWSKLSISCEKGNVQT